MPSLALPNVISHCCRGSVPVCGEIGHSHRLDARVGVATTPGRMTCPGQPEII